MRPSRILAFAFSLGAFAACTPPPDGGGSSGSGAAPASLTEYGPGDYCSDTIVYLQSTNQGNFSLGSSYFNTQDYCAAYPYLKYLIDNDPLFVGEDVEPDDRNYYRLASVYEQFAAQVDSTNMSERRAYLDSAVMMREMAREALDAEGIAYDPYVRDLVEGFFYFQFANDFEDAEERQFDAFNRAFAAKPDSLEDWYITQLFNGSALEYPGDAPNAARAEYLRRLAEAVDNTELQEFYAGTADYIEVDPATRGEIVVDDSAVRDLITRYEAGQLNDDEIFQLFGVVIQSPERIESVDGDVAALRSRLVRERAITDRVDNPRTLLGLAFANYADGNSSEGNALFARAIENAQSNAQRADFHYSRGVSAYGSSSDFNRALEYLPSHGPSLYRRAGLIANAVGRPSSVRGRFAYWCLADIYRNVAASSSDGQIAANARRAAAQYDRAGPSREQYFLEGFTPGQSVTASLGAYGSCTTRVR